MSETNGENKSTVIEFDNLDETIDKLSNQLEFPVEEDIINIGAWILLKHPNFFGGSSRGNLRYLFWFFNNLIIQGL